MSEGETKNAHCPTLRRPYPVIVGIGEITDRPVELTSGLEPLTLLVEALKRAEADSGAKWLGEIGSLDIVNFLSWRYQDPAKQLSDRLGIQPAHAYYGPVGGESPIRYLHEAAQRIARGECSVAAVCGAEAQSTATKAERAKVDLPWTPFAHDVEEPKRGAAFQKPVAVKLGVFRPVTVYPLYEAASAAHWARPRARRWRNPARCGRPIQAWPRKTPIPGSSGTLPPTRSRRRRRTTG